MIDRKPKVLEITEGCINGIKNYRDCSLSLDEIILPYRRINFTDCLVEVNKPVFFSSICLCDCVLIVNANLTCEAITWMSTDIYLKAEVKAYHLYDIESNPDDVSMIKSEFVTDTFKDIYDNCEYGDSD